TAKRPVDRVAGSGSAWCSTTRATRTGRRPPPRRSSRWAGSGLRVVGKLLFPTVRTPFRREVEQVPQRLQRAHVARILSGVGRREQELRAPTVPHGAVAGAGEHVEHRVGAVLAVAVVVAT